MFQKEEGSAMSPEIRILCALSIFFRGAHLSFSQIHSAKPIAKISSFKREVFIQPERKIARLTKYLKPLSGFLANKAMVLKGGPGTRGRALYKQGWILASN